MSADDAAARRAARKKARLEKPPPEVDSAYDGLSLADLRRMRAGLNEEETRVSYWRRLIQARLDLVRSDSGADPMAHIGEVLTEARGSHRRLAHVSVEPVEGLPPLPDLERLWAREPVAGDEADRAALVADLERAERELSQYRSELFQRIEGVTSELIARYRQDPLLALTALPTDDRGSGQGPG
ncbi:MAG: hypothetical protein R2737_17380 [Candidatus Nanopelagicales bacterium]